MFNIFFIMFFHPNRKIEKVVKESPKELKKFYDKVGLKPIIVKSVVKDFMLNSFGWFRNDISLYLNTNDAVIRQSVLENLETVRSSGQNSDMTLQDLFDTIIPNNVQTPAEIERFGHVLASRFEGRYDMNTKVSDLVEKVDEPIDSSKKEDIKVSPEV